MARGDALVLALRQRVVAAHQALQFGEFADHLGEQIGLGEHRRALGLVRHRRRPAGASSRASRSMRSMRSAWVPSFSWKTMPVELRQPVFEPGLQIGLVEEFRVRQPRADHALVAGDDRLAAVGGFHVGDEDEFVGASLPLSASRSTKHFWLARMVVRITSGGIFRKALVEAAHQHHRPFDQARDLAEQALRPRPARAPARRRGSWRRPG